MNEDPWNEEPATSANDASNFFESGAASCRFQNIGDVHVGKILDFKESQQRDIKSGEPAFWPDGNKKMMLIITIQTNEHDDQIEDDDGERRLYVNKPSGMFVAISSAIKLSKGKFAIGGTLAVKYIKNGKPKTPGFNAPKEYVAKYSPPTTSAITATQPQQNDSAPPLPPEIITAKKNAWIKFQASMAGQDTQVIVNDWRTAMKAYYLIPPQNWTAETWTSFAADNFIKRVENPIGDEQVFAEEDIPF